MTRCSQCGFENRETDRFCANCGTPLAQQEESAAPDQQLEESTGGDSSATGATTRGDQPSFMPPPVTPSFARESTTTTTTAPIPEATIPKTDFDFQRRREPDLEDASDPEWRMTSLGPPPPQKRRLWLWILLIIIGLCVIACVAGFIWLGFTDSGQEFIENVEATATAQAD